MHPRWRKEGYKTNVRENVAKYHPVTIEWYDLNARHVATFFWYAVIIVPFAVKSAGFRGSVYGLLTTLLKPIVSLPIICLLAYVAFLTFIAVTVGRDAGIWQKPPVVTATVWACTTGLSLLLYVGDRRKRDNTFRNRVVALLGPSTILAAVMGVSVQSIWWELIFVPILSILAFAVYSKRSSGLTFVSSVLLLAYAVGLISKVIVDWGSPETMRSLKQSILFPFWLTIGTLPYVQMLVVVERFRFSTGAKCKTVRSSEYGKDWPLTVDSAKLCCRFQAVWVEVNGRRYGVNGTAGAVLKMYGYACFELRDIWRDRPVGEGTGLKVNIGRLIQDGLALES